VDGRVFGDISPRDMKSLYPKITTGGEKGRRKEKGERG